MTDLICRKTMMRCQTPGMCSPFGGCQPSALADCKTTQSNSSAAPRQPEGDGLEVVGAAAISNDGTVLDMSTEHYIRRNWEGHAGYQVEPLCRLSDAQRAIAELRDRLDVMTQCADNYSRMFEESAEECEHLKACQENAMLHMTGLVAERDTLRQQRNNLAGLLREVRGYYKAMPTGMSGRIDAALAEVNK